MSGSLLVVTGPPGAGKSAVAVHLARSFDRSVLVAGDDFFAFLRSGRIEPWLAESDEQNETVTDAAAAATGAFVRGGYDTVYDGILGPLFIDRFVATLGVAQVDYAVLLPDVEVCVERVATRQGHGFSDESATRHMHQQFGAADLAERHRITGEDLAGDAASVAERVLSHRAAGDLRLRRHPRD